LGNREKCDSASAFRISAQIQNLAASRENPLPDLTIAMSIFPAPALNHFRCGKQRMLYL
jgi:hypothetical protein